MQSKILQVTFKIAATYVFKFKYNYQVEQERRLSLTNPRRLRNRRTVYMDLKGDRQMFLQQVSKKQFRTLYHNANTCR